MKIYRLESEQLIRASLPLVWDFFSSPANLSKITPARMDFRIVRMDGDKMFAGQKIEYRVTVLPLVRVTWVTEITEVVPDQAFVDEQLAGPYSLWRHRHTFEQTPEGVMMRDVVEYAIPLGILGRLANWLFVASQVRNIFDYRFKVVEKLFHPETVR